MTKERSRIALVLLLVTAAALYAVFIGRSSFRAQGQVYFTLVDDAMISMRYAQHLGAGQGLVWNIGEPPIEGFSNPGWVLVMTLLHLLHIPRTVISLYVMIISATILLANAALIRRICLLLWPSAGIAPLLAAAITAFYFPLVFWSLRGMELGLLTLLVGLGMLRMLRLKPDSFGEATLLGLILSAAIVVRMDAVLQVTVLLVYGGWARRMNRTQWVVCTALVSATLIAVLVWQAAYFGSALPNTYYQKVVGGSLYERVQHGALVFVQFALRDVLLMTLVASLGLWAFRELRTPESALLAMLFLVQCAYSVWVGGDYAEPELSSANRFITQGVPALIILFSIVVERMLHAAPLLMRLALPPSATALGLAALVLLSISGAPWAAWARDNAPLIKADVRRVRAGLAIAGNTTPDVTIAVHAAGQIPYYSERRTLDLLGLNDPVIAREPRRTSFYPGHDKWDYDYSIGTLQPDLIADNWIRLGEYIRERSDYRQLDNGMYVRVDTGRVDKAGLVSAFP